MADRQTEESVLDKELSDFTSQLYCHFCGYSFTSYPELDKHMEIEHGESMETEHEKNDKNNEVSAHGDTILTVRKQEDIKNADAKPILKSASGQQAVLHKCQFCNRSFDNRSDFEKHIEEGHDPFWSQNVNTVPTIIRIGKKEYMCPFCKRLYTKQYEVLRHIVNVHKKEVSTSDSASGLEYTLLKCDLCDKFFTCESELAIHKNRHTRNMLYGCPFCEVVTSAIKDTLQHMKRMHSDLSVPLDKESVRKIVNSNPDSQKDNLKAKIVYNDTSGKVETSSNDETVSVNTLSDTTNELYKVKIISAQPENEVANATDFPRERPKAVYKCPYCSLVTHYGSSLKKHMKRSHTIFTSQDNTNERKNYLLDPAQVTPDITNSIKKISSVELDVDKVSSYYQCPFCPYKGTQRSNIVRHLRCIRHDKERKNGKLSNLKIAELKVECGRKEIEAIKNCSSYFQCPFCSYRSVRKNRLRRHLNSSKHIEEKERGEISSLDISKLKVYGENEEKTTDSEKSDISGDKEEDFMSEDDHSESDEKNKIKKISDIQNGITEGGSKLDTGSSAARNILFEDKDTLETEQETVSNKIKTRNTNRSKQQLNDKTLGHTVTESKNSKSVLEYESIAVKKEKVRPQTRTDEFKNRKSKISEEKLEEISSDAQLENNRCPYCKFCCKRASALKFHINFNHQNVRSNDQHDLPKPSDSAKSVDLSHASRELSNIDENLDSTPRKDDSLRRHPVRSTIKKSPGTIEYQTDKYDSNDNTQDLRRSARKGQLAKRKLERSMQTQDTATVKRLKLDKTNTCDKGVKADKETSSKHGVVIAVDGTVIEEDDEKQKGDILEEDSLSDDTGHDTDERNTQKKGENDLKEVLLFVCPQCKGRFRSLQTVRAHIDNHHPTEEFGKDRIEVMMVEDDPKTEQLDHKYFKCPVCPKYSLWMKVIKYHIQNEHKDVEFTTAEIEIFNKENLTIQVDNKEEDISFGCPFCDMKFASFESTKRHMTEIHKKKKLSDANVYVHAVLEQTEDIPSSDIETESIEQLAYECPYCEEILDLKSSFERHVQILHADLCLNVKELKANIPEQSSDDTKLPAVFGCPKCDLKFRSLKLAIQHLVCKHPTRTGDVHVPETPSKSALKVKMYKCPFCEKCCEWKASIKKHIASFHENKLFDMKRLTIVERYRLRNSNAPEKFQCPVCSLQCRWKHSILKHARKFHPDEGITSEVIHPVAEAATVTRYICPYCYILFKWKNSIARHVGHVHKDKMDDFSADQIQTILIDAGEADDDDAEDSGVERMTKDDVTHLGMVEAGEENKLQLCECIECGLTFGSFASLWKHRNVTHSLQGKPFKCSRCPKCFLYQHQRATHEKKEHGDGKRPVFFCDQGGCYKNYSNKRGLFEHLKTEHGEEDPAARLSLKKEKGERFCEDCNTSFTSRNAYVFHMIRQHNKQVEKQHECKVCKKRFHRPFDLKDHMFVHMSTADLKCPIHGCIFQTKKIKYLGEHIGRQHGIKVDSKSLGQHFLSEEKMSADELLGIFTVTKGGEKAGASDGAETTELGYSVEPDEQIQQIEPGPSSSPLPTAEPGSAVGTGEEFVPTNENREEECSSPSSELPQESAEPGVKRYYCKSCNETFPSHRRLIKHKVADHPDDLEVHKCEPCSKTFFTAYDLKEHNTWHHATSKPHICDQCGKGFPILSGLHQHKRRHQEIPIRVEPKEGQVVCDLCGVSLRYRESLLTHMRRVHPETIECDCKICTGQVDSEELAKDSTVKYCSSCNKYFCKKIFFYCHMKGAHNTTARYKCDVCPEFFNTNMQKRAHMHQVHSDAKRLESEEEVDSEQVSMNEDNHHIIEISNDEQKGPKFLPKLSEPGLKAVAKELKVYVEEATGKHWKCLLCGQCFSKVKYFNMHVRRLHVRSEHQPYRCKICGAGFARVAEFRKHTRSHSGFRPLTCNICDKSFKQQCHLKEHILIHGTAKKYKCEICQGRYKQRGAMLAHVVRHDKLKPFKCHFCGVGFTIRGQLSKHMKKYLADDNPDTHMCHICHKTFAFFPLLLKHIQSHQEPNPFCCTVCKKTFAAYTSLYVHKVKQKHFVEEDYETTPTNVQSDKGMETDVAVDSLMDEVKTEFVSRTAQLTSIDENVADSGNAEPSAVEIVIQDTGNGEHTTYKVEGHTDVDILSIAKQLTEMSGTMGQEYFIEEVVQPSKTDKKDEEEEIMMKMLDADDDVKSNLERTLMLKSNASVDDTSDRNLETPDRAYVQIIQSLGKNNSVFKQRHENYENTKEFREERESLVSEYIGDDLAEREVPQDAFEPSSTRLKIIHTGSVPVSNEVEELVLGSQTTITPTQTEQDLGVAAIIVSSGQGLDSEEQIVLTETVDGTITSSEQEVLEEVKAAEGVHTDPNEDANGNFSVGTVTLDEAAEVAQVEEVDNFTPSEQELDTEICTTQVDYDTTVMENADSDLYEPPILQSQYVSQSNTEENRVDQNQHEGSEVTDTRELVPVDVQGDTSQNEAPMYMFKKPDGSFVYICVAGEEGVDSNEIINAALQADVYLEEQERDNSTLEAAEILKSVASGSNNILDQEQVMEDTVQDDTEQNLQIQVTEETATPDLKPGRIINDDVELSAMRRIIKSHDSSEKTVAYVCNICNSVLKSKKNLRHHLRRHARKEDRPLGCRQCNKRFVSNAELNRHMRVHTDDRPCACDVCGRRFRQPGHLVAHKYIHTGQKPFHCTICPAKFRTSTQLKTHLVVHSGNRIHKCEYCEKKYKTMRELTSHRATHSGLVGKNRVVPTNGKAKCNKPEDKVREKKHICYICGKDFSGKNKLDDHIAQHENLRSYSCNLCEKRFNTLAAAESHAYTHTDYRPEICEVCGLAFKNTKSLRRHQKTHLELEKGSSGASGFTCPACNKQCNSRGALYYHIGRSPECMARGAVKPEIVDETGGEK